MPAPPLPVQELDPDDLLAESEERSTSQTRRMGSNAQTALEIELRKSHPELGAGKPEAAPPAVPRPGPPAVPRPGAPAVPRPGSLPGVDAAAKPEVAAAKPEAAVAKPDPDEAPTLVDASPPEGAAPALPKPYLAGDVIAGKYRLTRIIGRGGMGAVWQAHNLPLDIDVAIKLIRRDRTAAGAAERLLTEARAAARLMHPAIVRVFDFGESEQGDPFIVMELLHGESLSAILRRKKRLTPAVAVQTLLPVAGALASAHNKGIVHRDLKPDNIIVVAAENGALVPKIVDFGIAKLMSPDVERHMTLAGEVLGSPDYMSPEQARGADNVGEATDVWAFSVVLYELVTGERPFDGPNYNALIASILTNDPLPITARGVHDPALNAIVMQGLAKEIGERPKSMKEIGTALAQWAVGCGIEDDVAGNPIAKQWLSGAARRLLTVQPEGEPALVTGGAAAAAVAGAPAAAGPPPPVVETIVGKRKSAPKLVWIAPAIAIVGVLGTVGYLERGRILELLPGAPASSASAAPAPTESASAAPSAAPSTAATDAPAASGDAGAPVGSAVPAASGTVAPIGSGKLAPWGKTPRKTKPPVPKNIKF
jgi:serine/threonine-protein kinase